MIEVPELPGLTWVQLGEDVHLLTDDDGSQQLAVTIGDKEALEVVARRDRPGSQWIKP